MRPDALCGLLAEPERLTVFAAVVLGATTPDEVAERAGLPARSVAGGLRRLAQGGVVGTAEGRLVADVTVFKDAVREYASSHPVEEEPLDPDRDKAVVLRVFVRILRAWHPDHATLRRYLVDEQFMTRERGLYWRIGGPVHV